MSSSLTLVELAPEPSVLAGPSSVISPDVPSLRQSFIWTFIGNVVYVCCQWGMLACLSKMGTTVDVGKYAIGLALTAPVFMFTNLQLRGVQATDARGDYRFVDYLVLRVLASAFALAIVCGIVCFFNYDHVSRIVTILH